MLSEFKKFLYVLSVQWRSLWLLKNAPIVKRFNKSNILVYAVVSRTLPPREVYCINGVLTDFDFAHRFDKISIIK
jgi:hypothetical protein